MARDVDRIKEKIDLVDLIKSYINLSPAGSNFKGLCPFHQEKTPSFVVSPDRQIWHCFGCGKGGDLISFVMDYENLEFPEALRLLADKAGIEIKSITSKDQKIFDTLYEINEKAKEFFVNQLKENKEALAYLKERGLKDKTIKEFELGYAPGGEAVTKHLLGLGYKMEDIGKAGLSVKRDSGLFKDKFIERIIFPIVSEIDRTVGFSGRIFTNREVPDSVPKYLNSPATPVYNKSKLLYGFNKSKPAIKKSKSTFIVEGYMDFLMLYQSGVKNIVAVAGTALTTPHLEKLRRITDTIILSFDNDLGGLRALESAMDNFSSFDFHVKTLNLGKYKDPAEAIQEDLEFFKQAISSTEPAFRYLFKRYLGRQDEMDVREKKKTVRHLIKKISKLDSVVEQDIWLKELSEKAKISEEAIKSELDDLVSNSKKKDTQKKKEDQVKPTARDRIDSIIEKILSLAFTNDSFLPIVKDNRDIFPDKYKDLIDNPKGEDSKLLDLHSSYLSSSMDEKSLNEEFEILMKFLKLDYLEKKRSQFQDFMRKADSEEELKKAVGKFNEVSIKIDNLKKGKIKPF